MSRFCQVAKSRVRNKLIRCVHFILTVIITILKRVGIGTLQELHKSRRETQRLVLMWGLDGNCSVRLFTSSIEAKYQCEKLTPSFLSLSRAPLRKSIATSSFSSNHWITNGSNHLQREKTTQQSSDPTPRAETVEKLSNVLLFRHCMHQLHAVGVFHPILSFRDK